MRYHLTHIRMTTIKKKEKVTRVGEGVRHWPLVHYWWESKMLALLWKSVWRFLEFNTESPCDPAILFLSVRMKELKAGSRTDTCTPVLVASLITAVKRQTQPKHLSINSLEDKQCDPSMQRNIIQPLKGREVLSHATAWAHLDDITLSGISQTHKGQILRDST